MDETACTQVVMQDGQVVMRLPRFRVRVVEGPDQGATAEAKSGRLVVGSSSQCDLKLTDRAVSRFHMELSAGPNGITLKDLGSTNGTRIGGVRVERATLPGALELSVGRTRLALELGDAHDEVRGGRSHFGELLGSSAAMQSVYTLLEKAAPTDVPVLLLGESGTGKELAARAVHAASPRAAGPFEVVDCGGLPPTLIESELFGHEKGAFTHAISARAGAFERANGGTLFLDELGELPLEVQPKLLRALGEGEVRRVGGARRERVDVRIVAATNRDLRSEVNHGTFRTDLYYRIAVMEVRMPPLRERSEDIPQLARELMQQIVLDRKIPTLIVPSAELLAELQKQRWAGNVRELRNYLEQLAVLQVPPPLRDPNPSAGDGSAFDDLLERPWREAKQELVERFERQYLEAALQASDGNVAQAARHAGVDRGTLFRSIRRLGLRGDD
ncbi:MAG: sigma 54-dependent Fis family transcriptional regulator [Polyangiaceae bacterium]|nr:sigma 54-dependent Fis family transcriptional regulator [Polyangiaceae bacterium]